MEPSKGEGLLAKGIRQARERAVAERGSGIKRGSNGSGVDNFAAIKGTTAKKRRREGAGSGLPPRVPIESSRRTGLNVSRTMSLNSSGSLATTGLGHKLPRSETLINDPIHKSITLPGFLVEVLDTPQFQRLRYIKQLGTANLVFPSAQHTRLEHSIGVAHLSMKLVSALRSRRPDLAITDSDQLCVGLAGLCHDLGHGPFSHLFDGEFIRGRNWSHEKGSVEVLKYLIKDNEIDLAMYGITERDITFVSEMILGTEKGGVRKGRGPEKAFLYDIINNERSGFDFDKIDYIMRDSFYCGVPVCAMDVERIISIVNVLPDENDVPTICFPEKATTTVFSIFSARAWLHTIVYQHKVVKACELMIRDVLKLANDHLLFKSRATGERLRMSDSIDDMSVYYQLKDTVLDLIEWSDDPKLAPARSLLTRLRRRDLYRCCGMSNLPANFLHSAKLSREEKEKMIGQQLLDISKREGHGLVADDFIVEIMVVHHGKGVHNPMDGLRFYKKQTGIPLNWCTTPSSAIGSHAGDTVRPPNILDSPPASQNSTFSAMSTLSKTNGSRCFRIDQERYQGALLPSAMGANNVRVFVKEYSKRKKVTKTFKKWTSSRRMPSPLCHNSQDDDGDEDTRGPQEQTVDENDAEVAAIHTSSRMEHMRKLVDMEPSDSEGE